MPHFNSKLFKRVIYFGWDDSFQEKHSFCCDKMDLAINFHCNQCRDDWECPDKIIYYNPVFDEYGVIIHDGSYSY
ncbi:MAG: hypothetical protein JW996_07135, partial [Candidatus Cloacimonetes bacterium]|nr:hypothetical protein [Candidatus Cloacimonadota bacterium]